MPNNSGLDNSDVNTLISFFLKQSGFQLANRFKISFYGSSIFNNANIPPLFATLVQIPGQAVSYYSDVVAPSESPVDLPLNREYDNRFIVDFIVDKNWNCREFFENWINSLFQDKTGRSQRNSYNRSHMVQYYNDIIGNMVIQPLDVNSNPNKTITMYGVWPASILPTQMMNDNPNAPLTLTIDFNYRYYTIY